MSLLRPQWELKMSKQAHFGSALSIPIYTCNEQEARYFVEHLSYIPEFWNETDFIEITG